MTRAEFALFCTVLKGLLEAKLPIERALRIISKTKKTAKNVKKLSQYCLEELQNGSTFSSMIDANPYITLPRHYTSLFSCEEKTGSIKNTLSFIHSNEMRKKESHENIIRSALYPFVIVALSCAGSLLLYWFRASFGKGIEESLFYTGFIVSTLFIVFSIIVYFFIAYNTFTDTDQFLFYFTYNFLLEAGFDTYSALNYTAMQFELGSSARKKISECSSLVSRGKTFYEAIVQIDFFPEKFLMLCEYAQESGDIKVTVCNAYEEEVKDIEKKRKTFVAVSEPCMIICAGVYLLLLVQYTVLPVLTNFGGVL